MTGTSNRMGCIQKRKDKFCVDSKLFITIIAALSKFLLIWILQCFYRCLNPLSLISALPKGRTIARTPSNLIEVKVKYFWLIQLTFQVKVDYILWHDKRLEWYDIWWTYYNMILLSYHIISFTLVY